jgi:hypothetical protein
MEKDADAMKKDAASSRRPAGEAGLRVPAKRAQIIVKDSEFGRVLFDANGQGRVRLRREIRCHNVELHGGLRWVVTPRGEPVS